MIDTNKAKRDAHAARCMRRSLPPKFCAAPFTQLFLTPQGDAFVCCEGAGHLGNINEKSVEELWNGPEARRLRREFLSGNPIECKKKMECRRCNETYDDLLPSAEISEVQTQLPIALDMMLNGQCNIDCIMCEVKTQTTSLPATEGYKKEIEAKLYPTVKRISLKSGEPLVQKETFEAISKVQKVNPDCEWQFTTNGQYKFAGPLQKLFDGITVQRINFSIDSIDPQIFADIRVRGQLDKALASLQAMQEWAQHKNQKFTVEFAVNATIQKKNWKVIPDLMKYFFDRGINTSLLFVEKPLQYSLLTLSEEEQIEIIQFYLNLPKEFDQFLPAIFKALGLVLNASSSAQFKKLGFLVNHRLSEIIRKKMNMCPFPFVQLALTPSGNYNPCCWLPQYDLRENKGDQALAVWNGKPLARLREEQLSGNNIICGDRMKRVGCHLTHQNLVSLAHGSPLPATQPLRFDWFFQGKCNLKCKSCNNWKFEEEFEGSAECFEDLKKNVLPYICEIDLKGGEPFYQKRTFELIEFMKKANPLCVWNITSNGQVSFTETLSKPLDGLMISEFAVSIDSLDAKKFNEIRTGGDLSKTLNFLDNLIAFKEARTPGRRFRIFVNFVFQKANWRETENIIQFCERKGLFLYLIPMVDPRDLSVYTMEDSEFNEMREYVDKLADLYPLKTVIELNEALKSRAYLKPKYPQLETTV